MTDLADFDEHHPAHRLRCGWPARIICRDAKPPFRIVALVDHPGAGEQQIMLFDPTGRYSYDKTAHGFDLLNAPVRVSNWLKVVGLFQQMRTTGTKELADSAMPGKALGYVEFVFEEDKLVDVIRHPGDDEAAL